MLSRTTSWQHGENHERFQNATEEERRKLQKKMTNGRTAFDIIDRTRNPVFAVIIACSPCMP
jgi:hypothetical protein